MDTPSRRGWWSSHARFQAFTGIGLPFLPRIRARPVLSRHTLCSCGARSACRAHGNCKRHVPSSLAWGITCFVREVIRLHPILLSDARV